MASLTVAGRSTVAAARSEAADPSVRSVESTNFALMILTVAAALAGFTILAVRWHQPLIGMHSFRQTQTAISSYSMLHGGPWLAYETPAVGPPWSIPYEFPLYQWMAAALVATSGIGLDPAGRLISYIFLLLTIIPARSLVRTYRLQSAVGWTFALLLLTSPLYLFWGTAFLIETLAVYLGFAFVAETAQVIPRDDWSKTARATIYGSLAALCKITTFAPFYVLSGGALLVALYADWKQRRPLRRSLVQAFVIMVVAPIPFALWDRFADAHKRLNPIGRFMASSAPMMRAWNFGTWSQLFSRAMLSTLMRSIVDTLGVAAPLILLLLAVLVIYLRPLNRIEAILTCCALGAFLAPFAVFTNLHIVHNYYDAANAIFLVAAVAIVLGGLFATARPPLAWAGLILIVTSQIALFCMHFWPDVVHPEGSQLIAIANRLKAQTSPDAIIVIYGQEWSPVIPYYAERRALMEPSFVPRAERLARLDDRLSRQDRGGVGAIVRCASSFDTDSEFTAKFATLDHVYAKQRAGGCDLYFLNATAGN